MIELKITPSEACKIISEQTGKTVTPETHWIRATIEMTQSNQPYACVRFEAHERS